MAVGTEHMSKRLDVRMCKEVELRPFVDLTDHEVDIIKHLPRT